MKNVIVTCDLCEAKIPAQSKKIQIQMVFTTEQTEGWPTKPYLDFVSIYCCNDCLDKIIEDQPVLASGAQGHNRYRWNTKKLDNTKEPAQ